MEENQTLYIILFVLWSKEGFLIKDIDRLFTKIQAEFKLNFLSENPNIPSQTLILLQKEGHLRYDPIRERYFALDATIQNFGKYLLDMNNTKKSNLMLAINKGIINYRIYLNIKHYARRFLYAEEENLFYPSRGEGG